MKEHIGRKCAEGTTAPAPTFEALQSPVARPEFIRLPKNGMSCPYTGLKRSKLNELILPSEFNAYSPPVKSVCIRNRGQKKGVRLIAYDSLVAYLRGLMGGAATN